MGVRESFGQNREACISVYNYISFFYLGVYSFVFLVLGGCLIGTAILLWAQVADLTIPENQFIVLTPMLIGVALSFDGLLGMYVVCRRPKISLVLFVVLTFVLAALLGVAALILTIFGSSNKISRDITNNYEGFFNDYKLAIFNNCCAEQGFGTPIALCSLNTTITDVCIIDSGNYDFLDSIIGENTCSYLRGYKLDTGSSLVDNPADGGCGGGDGIDGFLEDVSGFLSRNSFTIGALVLTVDVLMMLAILSSFSQCGEPKDREYYDDDEDYDDDDEEDEEKPKAPKSRFKRPFRRSKDTQPLPLDRLQSTRSIEHARFTDSWRPSGLPLLLKDTSTNTLTVPP